MGKSIYFDVEWFLNQRIYLIGYAYTQARTYQMYGYQLNKMNFKRILQDVDVIYCYGPDVGMLEKYFECDLRNNYICINLLTVLKRIEPNLPNYKLCTLEKLAGIQRETMEYKSNILQLHKDWYIPERRARALKYNREDVNNLIRVKNYFFQRNGITRKDIIHLRLQ
jgi:uncharacterized protein YprB with RNaseH-like and TPR domain